MKRHDEDALDTEERTLAAQLRRLPPHGEPDADLDARILAMARSATQPRPTATSRRHWPVYASAAAVCMLAAGLAWQLWPAHVQRNTPARTPEASPAPAPATPEATIAAAPPEDIIPPVRDLASDASVEDGNTARKAAPAVISPPPQSMPAHSEAAKPEPAASSDHEAQPLSAPAVSANDAIPPPPAPPAPPPPPAPPAPQPVAAQAATANAAAVANSTAAPAANAMRAKAQAETENGYDARPPATVQDANVRADWLKRIRELMAQGDRDGARRSLQEYKSRYPETAIPADLQPLLAPPPVKTP